MQKIRSVEYIREILEEVYLVQCALPPVRFPFLCAVEFHKVQFKSVKDVL